MTALEQLTLELLQLDWISFMPSAHATGQVTLKGKKYAIDTVAYVCLRVSPPLKPSARS